MAITTSEMETDVSTQGAAKLPSEEFIRQVAERVWQLLQEDLRLDRERRGEGHRS